jgi:hypothetical protein
MAGAANRRSALAPHFGHFFVVDADMDSIFSNRWWHFPHSYSYNGNLQSSQANEMLQAAAGLTRRSTGMRASRSTCSTTVSRSRDAS